MKIKIKYNAIVNSKSSSEFIPAFEKVCNSYHVNSQNHIGIWNFLGISELDGEQIEQIQSAFLITEPTFNKKPIERAHSKNCSYAL